MVLGTIWEQTHRVIAKYLEFKPKSVEAPGVEFCQNINKDEHLQAILATSIPADSAPFLPIPPPVAAKWQQAPRPH